MSSLIFVKLGGSLLTDKTQPTTARHEQIRACAHALARARQQRPALRLLLAHGSGSFGHAAAVHSRFGSGGVAGYVETGAAAAQLNRIVTDLLLGAGLPLISLQPSASAICRDGQLIELATHPISLALQNDLIPLIFGDVAFDLQRSVTIASTEMLFAFLARHLRPTRILLVGQVNGVFTADPLQNPDAQLISRITPQNFAQIKSMLSGSHGMDVTGGMLSKVQLMLDLVQAIPGLRAQIISGETPDLLTRALLNDDAALGTWIEQAG